MADRTVDDDFRTFRATGDPDALGRVFDAVAPRLLLVAAQLAPRHAEDLVQTTFVRAIERAASFDPARPLWPWLVGILALEAKTTRRRDARTADPARLPTHVEPDPTDAAATTETAEHLAAAVEGLPEPFRQVCVLRLVHGLEPVQIARALGIPAETARSRLSRGFERLRRALPAGLAAAIAAALPREGLAAMRARVLELAASAGAQPAVAVGGSAATAVAMLGWWTMNKKIAALACAAVVAALAVPFGLSLGRPAPPPDDAAAVPATRVAPHAVAERVATGDAGRDAPERVAVDAPAVPPPAAGTATLRGRCVDEDGAPLAGVTVTLHGRENDERAVQLQLETDPPWTPWADPEPAETGADGRFEFAFVPRPTHTFNLSIRAPGRPRLSGFWAKIDAAETVDVGDVVVRPGVRIRGRVLDAQGAPVGERAVHVHAGMTRPGRQGRFDAASSASGRTDARGRFEAREPVPAGRYWISVEGHRVVAPAGGVAVAEPTAAIEVVVEPASADDRPRIAGVVVAASGVPIAGAEIRVERGGPGPLHSGDDGSFEIRREARWPRSMPDDAVSVSVGAAGRVTWTSPAPVPWGTLDLRIELADGPPLTIRATRAEDGTPVERYGIVLMPLRDSGGTSSDDRALKHVGDHPDGVLALDRASTGRFLLSVVPPPSTGLAPSTDREIKVEPGFPLRIDVPVPRLAARVVEVVTADGTPIAGARVELLEPRDGGEVRTTTIALEASAARYNPPSVAALHDAASTDAGGRATVHGRGGQSFALRLPGPGHVPTVVPAFRTDDAEPARVVVGVGGTLRGRIGPPEVFAMLRTDAGLPPTGPVDESSRHLLPAVGLRGVGPRQGERFPAGMGSGSVLAVDPDGGFALSGVPPGTWEMQLRVPMSIPLLAATTARRIGDTVEIAEGEVRDVEVDLQAWLRQAVALEVRVDGAPFSGRLQLEGDLGTRGDGTRDTAQAFAQTDSDGLATAALRAGTWEVIVIVPRGDGEWLRMPGPTFRVVRGTPQLVGVDIRTASRRVVLLGPDGEPVEGLALAVRSAGTPFGSETAPTDADGHTTVFGPPGTVVLRARRRALRADAAFYAWLRSPDRPPTDDGLVDVGSIVLEPDPADPATVRLPSIW